MKAVNQLLIGRFWSHVFDRPDDCAVLIKNPDPREEIILGYPGPGGMGGVVIAPPRPYIELKWADVGAIVAEMIVSLETLGVKRGDRVAILSWNRPEWVWSDMAIQSIGAVSVPIYPNSTAEQVRYIVQDSGAKLLLADDESQLNKIAGHETCRSLSFEDAARPSVVYCQKVLGIKPADFDLAADEWRGPLDVLQLPLSVRARLAVQHFAKGQRSKLVAPQLFADRNGNGIQARDMASLIYTSGSTGQPKGVILTHGNIAASCLAVHDHGFDFNRKDLYLSYLPLAHCYERVNGQSICIWFAVPTAFCKVEEVSSAMKELRPTILLGVPAVWRKVKDKIQAELDKAKGLQGKLVKWAMAQQKPGLKRFIADALVFRKVRQALGGRLRIMGSGGAPIAPEVLAFFKSIGLDIIQGYGLTETAGAVAANPPHAIVVGSVGTMIEGVEIKLVPEGENPPPNSGVIWLRGGPVSPGYWNLPEENAKAYDQDGWFNTGDIGRLDEAKNLFITGRKKRLLKTEGGKYVAPEKVEKAFDPYPIVQAIVPVGDNRPFVSGLIFVNALAARLLIDSKDADFKTLIADPRVQDAVQTAVKEANKHLEHWEMVKKISLIEDEATVANGLLTATLKVRTEEALKRYADVVEGIYKK